jgi:hypothetical protein
MEEPVNFFFKQVKIPECADYHDIWERVICPSIRLKYTNLSCNINSDVRNTYKSYLLITNQHLTIASILHRGPKQRQY